MQVFIENDLDGQGRKNLRVLCVEHIASSTAMCNLQQISAASDSILMFLNRMFVDLHELLQSDSEIDLLKDFKHSEVIFIPNIFILCYLWFMGWNILALSLRIGQFSLGLQLVQNTLKCFSYELFKLSNSINFHSLYQNTGVSSAHPATQGELKFSLGKLGLGDHTLDLLEQVQAVVTRIGNVLGLMIILTAGCTRYSNNISRCVFKNFLIRTYYCMFFFIK